MKFESSDSVTTKKRFKIVRTDDYSEVEGEIITADEVTGQFSLQIGEKTENFNLGPKGIRIVSRRR